MKIVDRKTFLALPEGTVFSKYQPYIFGELQIKGSTLKSSGDFCAYSITSAIDYDSSEDLFEKLDRMEKNGEAVPMDFDSGGRDGCFDLDQLFAVWDEQDVRKLIGRLEQSIERHFQVR
jgi:hypothetical protein